MADELINTPLKSTDLAALHLAIISDIKKQFPDFQTIEFYRDDEDETMPLPACLLELDEMEPLEDDPGTEQIGTALRFAARLVFSREKDDTAPLQMRLAAAALAAFINKRRWSCTRVAPARLLSSSEDGFRPSRSGSVTVWRVEWLHPAAYFGTNIWDATSPVIRQVFVAQSPLQNGVKEIWHRDS